MNYDQKHYSHVINKNEINSIHSILVELDKLNGYLDGTELHDLRLFNQMYAFVDKELELAVSAGIFLHPDLVKKLDVAFVAYYFDALNYFAEHKRLPELWGDIITHKVFLPFYFLLGANVHINHDLTLAILDSIPNLKEFEKDFHKIDEVISESIKKFFKTYKPKGKFAKAKYAIVALFRKPVTFLILRWRHESWHSAQLITGQKLKQSDLARDTKNVSKKLVFYGKFLHLSRNLIHL